MQFKANKAFQLAVKARSSLDEAIDDAGLRKRSASALRAVTSAFAGAKGAVMVRPPIRCANAAPCTRLLLLMVGFRVMLLSAGKSACCRQPIRRVDHQCPLYDRPHSMQALAH